LKSLDQFIKVQYGKVGTPEWDGLEAGYESFKLGVLIQQATLEKRKNSQPSAEQTNRTFQK